MSKKLKSKLPEDSALRKEIEPRTLAIASGVVLLFLLVIGVRAYLGSREPAPTLMDAWLFEETSTTQMEGIYFDEQGYFARWRYPGATNAYTIWGGYSQNRKVVTFVTDKATWPDGQSMNGTAEILFIDDTRMELRVQDRTYKFLHRAWKPGPMSFAPRE